jgi:hypothetical protein
VSTGGLGSAVISGLLNHAGHSTGRRCRRTPSRVLEILWNPTYAGRLPFNGQAHQAQHAPLVDAEVFARAQRIVAERERSWRGRAANATDYLLTRFLRCGRCGYGLSAPPRTAMAAPAATHLL